MPLAEKLRNSSEAVLEDCQQLNHGFKLATAIQLCLLLLCLSLVCACQQTHTIYGCGTQPISTGKQAS